MKLNELIKIVKDNNLIETISDIEFLFLDCSIKDETQPISILIDNVITWGYENDDLKDFYSEHLDFLIDNGIVSPLIECKMTYQTSMGPLSDNFGLFCFESKNYKYYKVKGDSDRWDTYGFYEIVKKNSRKTDVISQFKDECDYVFSNFGEFDDDEDDSEIEFFP